MTKWLAKFRFEAVNRILEGTMASTQINLYRAKTQLSSLVERAANGEEIIIAKAGKPTARLTALAVPDLEAEPSSPSIYREFGKGLLGVIFLSEDWEEDIPPEYFRTTAKRIPSENLRMRTWQLWFSRNDCTRKPKSTPSGPKHRRLAGPKIRDSIPGSAPSTCNQSSG